MHIEWGMREENKSNIYQIICEQENNLNVVEKTICVVKIERER